MSALPDSSARRELNPNSSINRLVSLFSRSREANGLPPGELAELRRMDPTRVLPPACWRQLVVLGIAGDGEERAWALLMRTMLQAGAMGERSIGSVLASPEHGTASYAEQRFVRLLRARGLAVVAHEAGQAASWCAARGGRMRFSDMRGWDGFGPFILAAAQNHDAEAERRGHAIARDYFATQRRAARAPESAE